MLKNTYQLKIENLKITSCQGVLDSEKVNPQEFVLNIIVHSVFPYQDAANDVFDTVNCYGNVRDVALGVFESKTHNTIETIASIVIEKIFLLNASFYKVELEIKKTQIYSDCTVGIKIIKEKTWHNVYLSFGSNIGDKKNNILNAYKFLELEGIIIENKSKITETLPMYKLDQDKFCNSVAGCRTFHSPEQLLHIIEKIMTLLGRVRVEKNGPRSIDIDILFYDDIKIQNPSLTIPHPKIAERKFVLSGLKEVGFVF